jgi:hypothetical protein
MMEKERLLLGTKKSFVVFVLPLSTASIVTGAYKKGFTKQSSHFVEKKLRCIH